MSTERVGHGVLSWDGVERRTDRYGAFVLDQKPYNGSNVAASYLDLKALESLVGHRVHVWCKVVSTRESGHIGDLFLGIRPTTPDVGEVVDLGVGILQLNEVGWGSLMSIVLKPGDGRETFWIDPHRLYRLHDQTVDVFVEATEAEFSPAPDLKTGAENVVAETGGGAFQAKGVKEGTPYNVPPDVEKIGDGMFIMTQPSGREYGKRRKITLR